jgi:hypothetical protein
MNAQEAIEEQRKWKARFMAAIAKHEQLNIDEIAAGVGCLFSTWLHGAGKDKHGALASYGVCVAKHAVFHHEAAKVAERINNGEGLVASQQVFASNSPIHKAAELSTMSIIALFREIEGLR